MARGGASLWVCVGCAQFSAQLDTLSKAVASGQMDLSQFGLSGAAGFSVADFLQARARQSNEREANRKSNVISCLQPWASVLGIYVCDRDGGLERLREAGISLTVRGLRWGDMLGCWRRRTSCWDFYVQLC